MLRALVIAFALLASATPPGLAEESAAAPDAEAAEDASPEDHLLAAALAPWTGDFDGVVERGFVRIATSYSPFLIHYGGKEIEGVLVELMREFETALAQRAGRRIDAVVMLLPRDQILDAVLTGRADIAAANLTVTPARAARVAFSKPLYTGVRELVATGPAAPAIAGFDDLAAVGLHLRPSSSYREHLDALNAARAAEGRAAIPAIDADERLILLGVSGGFVLITAGDADAEGGGPGLWGLIESAAEADVHWVARELGLLEDDADKELRVAGQAVDADLAKAQRWETQKAQAMVQAYRSLEKGFDPGAAIALFLGEMQEALKAMPAMRDDMDAMRIAMEQMNMKMSAMPVMAGEMQAMSARIGVMTYGIDSTMGRTGRMVPFMSW